MRIISYQVSETAQVRLRDLRRGSVDRPVNDPHLIRDESASRDASERLPYAFGHLVERRTTGDRAALQRVIE